MISTRTVLFVAMLGSLTLPCAPAATVSFDVTVNTASLVPGSGNLDFLFLKGAAGAPAATAVVSGFTGGGGMLGAATVSGGVSGALSGTVTLTNATSFNDLFQAFTFGSQVRFLLTLTTPSPSAGPVGAGTTFSFSLYNSAGDSPLLTTDPSGAIFTVDLNNQGSAVVSNFNRGVVSAQGLIVVPEPSGTGGIALALAWGLAVCRHRRQAA